MITNLISFLYDIEIETIRKNNNSYIFYYSEHFYIFRKCYENEERIDHIYKYIYNNSEYLYHIIVKNKHNKYVSNYNNENYILMMVKFNLNRKLMFNDVYDSTKYYINYIKIKDFSWGKLWKQKIDQVEYYINNNNLHFDILTLSIINYYLMLSENALIFYNFISLDDYVPLSLCHNRIEKDTDLYDYFSVTNLVLDHKTRDFGEFIKNYIYSNKNIDVNEFYLTKQLTYNEKVLLISRIIFPSYFFDVFDDFVINNRDFKEFYKSFLYIEIYRDNLKKMVDFIAK